MSRATRLRPSRPRIASASTALGRGVYAKTDAIDAKALAEYASMHMADLRPFVAPSADNQALAQLTRRRCDLIAIRTQERNRLQAPDNGCLRQSINMGSRSGDPLALLLAEISVFGFRPTGHGRFDGSRAALQHETVCLLRNARHQLPAFAY